MKHKLFFNRIYISNPLKTSMLVPNLIPDYMNEPISLKKRILKVLSRVLIITSTLLGFLIFTIGGTILIIIFCPVIYPLWLLITFMAGYLCAEIIFI